MSERNNNPNMIDNKTHEITREHTSKRGFVKIKHAGYAYDGCVHRNGKAIPVADFVDTLNSSAMPNVVFRVEELR